MAEIFTMRFIMKRSVIAVLFAVSAAALYAINVPFSKLLMPHASPVMMAGILYLGAGLGLILFSLFRRLAGKSDNASPLTRRELPYTIAMVLLDIAAPILLMTGITMTSSASVSLLNNFEIVATSLIALVIFGEFISAKLWAAIGLVVVSSVILTWEPGEISLNAGSLLVLGACVCWGFENNCTRMISGKSTVEIVTIKGIFSGMGGVITGFIAGEHLPSLPIILSILLLGFVSYGLSICFYIRAQRDLGAAKTSAYYSIAPFLGVAFSMVLLGELPDLRFYLALSVMAAAAVLMVTDSLKTESQNAPSAKNEK